MIKKMITLILLIFVTFISALVFGQEYQVVSHADGATGISFKVPYSAGIHDGAASSIAGNVKADLVGQNFSGQFVVPIDSMKTGNGKRDCHMRESLGLDYSKSSFPVKHVCDNKDSLPDTGNDAVAFANIEFDLVSLIGIEGKITLQPGKIENATATGRWVIHGVSKDVTMPATIAAQDDGTINVKFTETLMIADFNSVVKPILGIGVRGDVKLALDLVLKPK